MNGHHIWCNGHPNSPVDTCKWCGGPNGLHAKYPEDCSPSELVKKYFPNVMARNVPVEEMNNETEPHGEMSE